jgi:hypothetical protein
VTWSYDTALATSKDQVRFYASDTESSAAITVTDEEIAGLLTLAGGVRSAAAMLCDHLALRYSQRGQQLTDDIGQSVNYGDIAKQFTERGRLLRSQASFAAVPFAGGISVATKQAQLDNSDRVRPAFGVSTHEAPGSRGNDGVLDD